MSTLAKKLRITSGTQITVVQAPDNYEDLLGPLPEQVSIRYRLLQQSAFVHWFVHNKTALEAGLHRVVKALAPGALLWIIYPKHASGRQTDLTRDKGWECLDGLEMEWLSLVSFSEDWSAFLMRNTPPKKKPQAQEGPAASYYDTTTKTVLVPEDLAEAFRQEKKAKAIFDAYAYSHRKEYVVWIVSAKRPETRASRVVKTIEMLLAGKKNPADK
ncbi:MAG TPA: YdeI/OmpD-associated family protein [Chitinophagaceae bacterium]|nr:YdeI/OmpD-associated family protein [Chitinophagaceae bacterium]